MTTVASLDRTLVEVTPGDEATCLLEVTNDGAIVETYTVEVLGPPAAWTVVEPAEFSVFPGTSERVTVRFRPPRTAQVPAGELAYAMRVVPTERPEDAMVPEGVVQVLPFVETIAEIVPRTSRSRWGARHELSVDNRGNVAVPVTIGGSDPDDRLDLVFRPESTVIGAGQAAFVTVRARPKRVLWRGFPVTYPFQVVVQPDGAPPTTLDAATMQVPIIPRGAVRLLVAAVLVLLALAGIWWGLLRPAVQSVAREVADDQIAPIAQKADQADAKAQQAVDAAAAGGGPSPSPTASPSATPDPGLPGQPPGATGFTRRLAVTVGGGATRTDQYTVPTDRTFVLTDIIFQNPQGDEGRLDLIVDGTTVLTVALNNFRDLDYHLVSPIEAGPGRVVSMRVNCRAPGAPLPGSGAGGQCRDFALLTGFLRPLPPSPNP
nr:hypothetical protein [Micromonospora sp. DSM 115978]